MNKNENTKISKQEKFDYVLSKIKEHQITNYELEQNTGVSQAGLGSITKGETKNPRSTTVNALFDYIKNKYDVSEVQESMVKGDDKSILKTKNFSKLSLEKKLDSLFEQNIELQNENVILRKLILKQEEVNQKSKNTIIDYIDLYLKPVFDYIHTEKKERENK